MGCLGLERPGPPVGPPASRTGPGPRTHRWLVLGAFPGTHRFRSCRVTRGCGLRARGPLLPERPHRCHARGCTSSGGDHRQGASRPVREHGHSVDARGGTGLGTRSTVHKRMSGRTARPLLRVVHQRQHRSPERGGHAPRPATEPHPVAATDLRAR